MFELAESHCRRQLAEAYVGKRRRTEATVELSRTLLEWALYSKPPQRDERFAAALKTLDELRFDAADEPWRTPLHVQRGVAELVWGELLREEAQTLNAPESGLAPARDHLGRAVTALRQALKEIDSQLQAAARTGAPTNKPDELSPAEWTALKRNAEYQLARAYRNQAKPTRRGAPIARPRSIRLSKRSTIWRAPKQPTRSRGKRGSTRSFADACSPISTGPSECSC